MAPYIYPLSMPSTPAPAQTRLYVKRMTGISEAPTTGVQQIYQHPYALWHAQVSLPPMKRALAGDWQAFFLMLRGRSGTFLMGDRDAVTPRGTARTATMTGGTALTNEVTLSTNGTLLNGDYVQIGSGGNSRLHMIVAGGNSNGVFTIEPVLKASYGAGTPVTVVGARGLWRLAADDIGWDSDAASIYGFTFACHEAF